jgi:arylsulfatase A-like enzyme
MRSIPFPRVGSLPGRPPASIALLALLAAAATQGAEQPQPTNVVLMLIDNVGYGDLACYGNREIQTPHVDRLAREGVRCTDFYVGSPSCMPSRGALLTGRHPLRNGLNEQIWRIDEMVQIGLAHRELLLPHFLKPRGYAAGCFGKWNLGFAPGSRPTERGFDEFFGHASGNLDYYTHVYNGRNDLFRGTEPVAVEGYSTDLFADAACEFIRRHRDRPFFCYVPFNAAHFPNRRNKAPGEPIVWQAPAEYFECYGYSPDEQDEKKRYRAVITALDAGIGRVVDQVDSLGLRDRTLVILFSDNGAFMLPGRGLEVASNLPLRDGGVTLYEGGIRVPCLIRWPGRIAPGSLCREPLVSMDLFVMALRAAGAELPDDRVIDGEDPTAALAGEAPSGHRHLFFQWGPRSAVRSGRYKLLRNKEDEPFQLYDLVEDLGETTDLALKKPEVAAALAREFERWRATVGD